MNDTQAEVQVLRDLFASHALNGIMAKMASTTMPQGTREALAKLAYQMADAMVEERAKWAQITS